MGTWQLQQAKAKLSEVIDTAERSGPQFITRRGIETAVLVPLAEWNRISGQDLASDKRAERQKSMDLLAILQSGPDFEIPDRHRERLERRKQQRPATSAPRKSRVSS
jgi:prevent-host-death family protein